MLDLVGRIGSSCTGHVNCRTDWKKIGQCRYVMSGAGAEIQTRESRFERLERSLVSPEMGTRTGEVRR